jgi:predicted protein tyrosine phosphatase
MPKQFFILPRYVAGNADPVRQGWGRTAMIRISSAPFDGHPHQDKFEGIIELDFDDISEKFYEEYIRSLQQDEKPKVRPISDEDADKIVQFAQHYSDVDTFVVHCDAGISRSSGVMLALCETLFEQMDCAHDIMESGRFMPNATVIREIYRAYERLTGNKITYE